MSKTTLSRRAMLQGAGGLMVALPFLNIMRPKKAHAGPLGSTRRYVGAFAGTVVGVDAVSSPGGYGALPASLPASWAALSSVRQHISIISNLNIPTYNSGTTPTAPASAYNQQHGTTPAPLFAGVTSRETMQVMVNGQTADQIAADGLGAGSRLASLQCRTQAINYSGGNNNNKGILSARVNNGQLFALPPIASPALMFETLFSGIAPTPGGDPVLARRASVLDLVADDAARLQARLGADDRARMEQHFTEIRALEASIRASLGGGGGGGICTPGAAPQDPAIGPNQFGGWSNETLRGQIMADLIAYALACDMTRAVSWMMTFDQVFMADAYDAADDMHEDSHNGSTRQAAIGANANWHSALFARLIEKLASLPEGAGTVLDSTFLTLMFAESKTAHGRSGMRHVIAGVPSQLRLGQHLDGGGAHPGKIHIAGFQALGLNTNSLGELTGPLTSMQL